MAWQVYISHGLASLYKSWLGKFIMFSDIVFKEQLS